MEKCSSNGGPPSAPFWYSAGGALGQLWEDNLTRGRGRGNGSMGVGSGGHVGVQLELVMSGVESEGNGSPDEADEGTEGAALLEGWSFLSKDTFPM